MSIRDIENTIPEAQGNSEGIDINFEKMLDFYKKDTDKYTTLNNLDNDFPTIIKSLYSKIKELSKFGEEKDITLTIHSLLHLILIMYLMIIFLL